MSPISDDSSSHSSSSSSRSSSPEIEKKKRLKKSRTRSRSPSRADKKYSDRVVRHRRSRSPAYGRRRHLSPRNQRDRPVGESRYPASRSPRIVKRSSYPDEDRRPTKKRKGSHDRESRNSRPRSRNSRPRSRNSRPRSREKVVTEVRYPESFYEDASRNSEPGLPHNIKIIESEKILTKSAVLEINSIFQGAKDPVFDCGEYLRR